MSNQQYSWSQKSLDELEAFYWDTIAPTMRRDGLTPDQERPTYQWLADHGFAGLAYALREHHELTLTDFFVDVVGVGQSGGDVTDEETYAWGIDHQPTIDALEAHLRESEYEDLAASTLASRRSHLAQYVRAYANLHGTSDLLTPLQDIENKLAETERVRAVAAKLRDELGSDQTARAYLQDVQLFYRDHLEEYERARFDPTRKLTKPLANPDPRNPALDAAQVQTLYQATDDPESRLLVLALAGWGLRRAEVAALHRSQIVLEREETTAEGPYIAFDERKNGPSTVSLLFGHDLLTEHLATLADTDGWNGYVFPSAQAESGHIDATTVWRRLRRLGEQAGVTVDGSPPKPHQARRFWFREYQQAQADLLDLAEEIGADQGSDDARTIVENYWSDQERRQHRRRYMRDRLAAVFDRADTDR